MKCLYGTLISRIRLNQTLVGKFQSFTGLWINVRSRCLAITYSLPWLLGDPGISQAQGFWKEGPVKMLYLINSRGTLPMMSRLSRLWMTPFGQHSPPVTAQMILIRDIQVLCNIEDLFLCFGVKKLLQWLLNRPLSVLYEYSSQWTLWIHSTLLRENILTICSKDTAHLSLCWI